MAAPKWVKDGGWVEGWEKPWTVPLDGRSWRKFKAELRRRGLLSPHFSIAEAASHADSCGNPTVKPSGDILRQVQKMAFHMERLRHELGGVPLGNYSWYRTWPHNRCVGSSAPYHPRGMAVDPKKPASVSLARWNQTVTRVFAAGGVGYEGTNYVKHVDHGPRRRF